MVAEQLLGCWLVCRGEGGDACDVGGVIVEAEAYDQADPASHSHRGPTPRCRAMFGPPGHAYVYRSYGLHWCLNVVTGPAGHGAAVLIRALWPRLGLAAMAARRGQRAAASGGWALARGPGCVTQALGIDGRHDRWPLIGASGHARRPARAGGDVAGPRLYAGTPPAAVARTARIGISRAADRLWRFAVPGCAAVSGKRLAVAAR